MEAAKFLVLCTVLVVNPVTLLRSLFVSNLKLASSVYDKTSPERSRRHMAENPNMMELIFMFEKKCIWV